MLGMRSAPGCAARAPPSFGRSYPISEFLNQYIRPMATFIEQLSRTLLQQYGAQIGEICVVFPSRRAGVFMQDSIATASPTATWAPALFAIEDFVPLLHQSNILDPISLTFELFPVYQELFPNETFDQFYAWGQLMVADFEEPPTTTSR